MVWPPRMDRLPLGQYLRRRPSFCVSRRPATARRRRADEAVSGRPRCDGTAGGRGPTPSQPSAPVLDRRTLLLSARLRIAHVVCTDEFAGVERYVVNLSKELARAGCDVVVLGGAPE